MHFLALVSGGKDSFYNIHHCLQQGHELVALGNLHPELPDKDEIDSFMFQTVGHEVIDCYAECLDVPLYRQAIHGSSSNQNLEYSKTENDEIEDLYTLIKMIVEKHPEIKAVSCGAILSHYQRTRVENVCSRLGLTSLTYLWQRPQYELMQEMCLSGLEARLIKVAAIGLGASDLGKTLQEMFPKLVKLNSMYDVHICGEGGEFETLVFDASFFKKRLQIVDREVVTVDGDVAYLRSKVEVVSKDDSSNTTLDVPTLLEPEFELVLEDVELGAKTAAIEISTQPDQTKLVGPPQSIPISVTESETALYISNIIADGTPKEAIESIFQKLSDILQDRKLSFDNIQHVTLLLSDMADFEAINATYEKSFGGYYLPPSRVCVQTNVKGVHLSCTVGKSSTKQGIHIQSRSYWAPQNIGPYSQAIIRQHPKYKMATLSGQIPLIPATMELSKKGPEFNSVLALQHLHRVKDLVGVRNLASIVCFITDLKMVPVVVKVWEEQNQSCTLIIVRVERLPRGADVEWSGLSYEEVVDMYADDDEDDLPATKDNMKSVSFAGCLVHTGFGSLNQVQNMIEKLPTFVMGASWNEAFKNAEFIPVLNVYDEKGHEQDYGVVILEDR